MKVVGVDLSLTATGVASIETWRGGIDEALNVLPPKVTVIKSAPDGDTLHSRFIRMEAIAASVVGWCKGADLVAIEGPSFASQGGSSWDRAGLWWWVVSILQTLETPVAEVPPTVLKKWATGKGQAKKTAVAVAISRMWPEVATQDDNDSDALCLATMGAQQLNAIKPPVGGYPMYRLEALGKVKWPNGA